MSKVNKVLLVGHCGFDSGSLRQAVAGVAGNVPVKMVNDDGALDAEADADALLLVNRALDGMFAAGDGIELIAARAQSPDAPKMMLVSNYPDAQAKAEQAGALPGFGKSNLFDATTTARLKEAIEG